MSATRLLATVPVLLALAGCQPAAEAPPPAVRPLLSMVIQPVATAEASFVGVVSPRISVTQAFRVGGTLINRAVGLGDQVRAGAALADLDATTLDLAVETAPCQPAGRRGAICQCRRRRGPAAGVDRERRDHRRQPAAGRAAKRRGARQRGAGPLAPHPGDRAALLCQPRRAVRWRGDRRRRRAGRGGGGRPDGPDRRPHRQPRCGHRRARELRAEPCGGGRCFASRRSSVPRPWSTASCAKSPRKPTRLPAAGA
jgi:hypothetical protein